MIEIRVTGPDSSTLNEVIDAVDRLFTHGAFVDERFTPINFEEAGTFRNFLQSDLFTTCRMKWNDGTRSRRGNVNYTYFLPNLFAESVAAGTAKRLNSIDELSIHAEGELTLSRQIFEALESDELSPIIQHFSGPDGTSYEIFESIFGVIKGAMHGRLHPTDGSKTLEGLLGLVCQGLCPMHVEGQWPGEFKIYAYRFFPKPGESSESFKAHLKSDYQPPTIQERLDQLPDEVWEDPESLLMIESDLVPTAIERLDSQMLHELVAVYNWDDGNDTLESVLDHPECDRATALLVYWMGEPSHWAGKTASDCSEYEQSDFELHQRCDAMLKADEFKNREIEFNAREELGGIDSYWKEIEANPHIPAEYWQ